jgi:hypothetical protein
MDQDQRYQHWKERRAAADVPGDFVDKVITAVQLYDQRRRRRMALQVYLSALLTSRWGKIGLCALAILVCAFRVLHVFAVFVPE